MSFPVLFGFSPNSVCCSSLIKAVSSTHSLVVIMDHPRLIDFQHHILALLLGVPLHLDVISCFVKCA